MRMTKENQIETYERKSCSFWLLHGEMKKASSLMPVNCQFVEAAVNQVLLYYIAAHLE